MSVGSTVVLQISALFSAATIQLNLRCSKREDILRELVESIPAIARSPETKDQLHRALLAREDLCSTGLGRGIAIPHTRNTIAAAAGRTLIVFGRHTIGVEYGAADQMPIRLFFLLLAPDIHRHLHTLSRLTRILRGAEVREQLLCASSPQDVIAAIRMAETRGQAAVATTNGH
jgi:mannitol/fructose-specific phosphotransferase system IIA component (Ntr-type)